jgi:hypothetical protein
VYCSWKVRSWARIHRLWDGRLFLLLQFQLHLKTSKCNYANVWSLTHRPRGLNRMLSLQQRVMRFAIPISLKIWTFVWANHHISVIAITCSKFSHSAMELSTTRTKYGSSIGLFCNWGCLSQMEHTSVFYLPLPEISMHTGIFKPVKSCGLVGVLENLC